MRMVSLEKMLRNNDTSILDNDDQDIYLYLIFEKFVDSINENRARNRVNEIPLDQFLGSILLSENKTMIEQFKAYVKEISQSKGSSHWFSFKMSEYGNFYHAFGRLRIGLDRIQQQARAYELDGPKMIKNLEYQFRGLGKLTDKEKDRYKSIARRVMGNAR